MMVILTKQKRILASVLLASILILKNYGQQKEFFNFENYLKLGITGSIDLIEKGNVTYNQTDSPVFIKINKSFAKSFGINYLLFKNKYINLKVGLNLIYYNNNFVITIDKNQIDDFIHIMQIGINGDTFINLPLYFDYMNKINNNISLELSITPILSYSESYYSNLSFHTSNFSISLQNADRSNKPLYYSIKTGLGLLIKTKWLILNPKINYNYCFRNIVEGKLFINGIKNKPYNNVNGKFYVKGNYLGLEIIVYPKRFW